MRVFEALTLLAAALPAISTYAPPPPAASRTSSLESQAVSTVVTFVTLYPSSTVVTAHTTSVSPPADLCLEGTQRCRDNNLEQCAPKGFYKVVKNCSEDEVCTIVQGRTNLPGKCSPKPSSSPVNPPGPAERCTANHQRCRNNQVEACLLREHWMVDKKCADSETCFEDNHRAYCAASPSTKLPAPSKPPTNGSVQERCTVVGQQRCVTSPMWTIEECSPQLEWHTKMICQSDQICSDYGGRAQCDWVTPGVHRSHTTSPRSETQVPEPCTPGEQKCSADNYGLYKCGDDQRFHIEKKCAAPGDCKVDRPGQAHCQRGGMDPPKVRRDQDVCYYPGEQKCSPDNSILYKCGPTYIYHVEKTCTYPGDCKVDGPGQAHCERGGINPPKTRRDDQRCTPGDRACDSERRFQFECDDDGTWDAGQQCYKAGACGIEKYKELRCTGFPFFEYPADEHRVCETNRSCEFEGYLYCSAGSSRPEVKARCLWEMCSDAECADCDRCTFKPPYGGIKPDLSTLWSPSRED